MTRFLVEDWMMGCGLGLGGYEMPIFAYAYSFFREGKTLFASEGSIAALMGCSQSFSAATFHIYMQYLL